MRPHGAGKARNYCTPTLSASYIVPQRKKQRADFPLVFFFFLTIFNQGALWERQGEAREREKVRVRQREEGGIILHLPQYVSSLIRDEQLSVMQPFFFFFALTDFPSTCGIAD